MMSAKAQKLTLENLTSLRPFPYYKKAQNMYEDWVFGVTNTEHR